MSETDLGLLPMASLPLTQESFVQNQKEQHQPDSRKVDDPVHQSPDLPVLLKITGQVYDSF